MSLENFYQYPCPAHSNQSFGECDWLRCGEFRAAIQQVLAEQREPSLWACISGHTSFVKPHAGCINASCNESMDGYALCAPADPIELDHERVRP